MTPTQRHLCSFVLLGVVQVGWLPRFHSPKSAVAAAVAGLLGLVLIWSRTPRASSDSGWAVAWGFGLGWSLLGLRVLTYWGDPNCEYCAIGLMISLTMGAIGAVLVPLLVAIVRWLESADWKRLANRF